MIAIHRVYSKVDDFYCGGSRNNGFGTFFGTEDEAEMYIVSIISRAGGSRSDFEIHTDEVDTIHSLIVVVSGSVIGYQFNSDSMGERTFKRTVRNIKNIGDDGYNGEVTVLGRNVKVQSKFLGMWRSVEMIGYTN